MLGIFRLSRRHLLVLAGALAVAGLGALVGDPVDEGAAPAAFFDDGTGFTD